MDDSDRVWRERGLREAVLSGNVRAWQTWYDTTFASLDAYVLWRCGGLRDLADDVVQETWLVAVRHVQRFNPDQAAFATWLRGIAANVLRNGVRKRRSEQRHVALTVTIPVRDDTACQQDNGERIARALAELPERYEQVLQAKYLDQKSVADIAAEWGETPKAVESLLSRAREAFRAAFRPDE